MKGRKVRMRKWKNKAADKEKERWKDGKRWWMMKWKKKVIKDEEKEKM